MSYDGYFFDSSANPQPLQPFHDPYYLDSSADPQPLQPFPDPYYFDSSANPQPIQPFPDPYFFDPSAYLQPTLCYPLPLLRPPPPNWEPYPRLTVKQKDWSPSRQCFIGHCKVVAKIEGPSLPDYQCRAVYTLSYVPLAGWVECSAPCPDGPVAVNSRALRVSWDANGGNIPVIEAKTSLENHWMIMGVATHGPCELMVTSAEGSDLPSYSCPAIYTLKCDPLEGWSEVYDTSSDAAVPQVPNSGAGSTVANSKGKEQGTFPAAESSKISGQNEFQSISSYEFPRTESDYLKQYRVPNLSEGHVHNGNAMAKIQGKVDIPNMNLKTDPITESSQEKNKTCALQNKVSELQDLLEFYEEKSSSIKQRIRDTIENVRRNFSLCINSAIQKPETSSSTLFKHDSSNQSQVVAAEGQPKNLETLPATLISKSLSQVLPPNAEEIPKNSGCSEVEVTWKGTQNWYAGGEVLPTGEDKSSEEEHETSKCNSDDDDDEEDEEEDEEEGDSDDDSSEWETVE